MLSLTLLSARAADIEEADTMLTLNSVTVTARRHNEVIPAQTLQGDELRRLNSQNVADALRYFSGVQIKDYGGVGGIKTVNIRSMGTNHTGVVYDGVELGNAQNGQIDLGQFSLDNMEAISLYNGQKSNILQPAKDFGSGGSIYMRTRTPVFDEGETFHFRGSVRTGSFDLINPSALVEFKLSERVNAQISGEWINSSGKYKFRYHRVNQAGATTYDTTAVRRNGDINATRIEANLYGSLPSGSWHAKAYNYVSKRGIPGAIVNNVWRRGERVGDCNTFVQGRYTAYHGRLTSLNNIKYAFYRTHYVNNDYRQITINNLYRQHELYLSTANMLDITPWWQASAGYDFMWNTMSADLFNFTKPDRFTHYISLATAISLDRFKLQASMMGTLVHDKLQGKKSPADKHVLTPALFLSGQPIKGVEQLSVRAFFKQSYRMPTFNDLYYTDAGNSSLDPERVSQYNVGIALQHASASSWLTAAGINIDAYYNYVKNKIVAYPKGQQFRWTMLNLGRVDIRGIDVSANATVTPLSELHVTARLQYTYQRAIDITNPADSYYRDQIPYIPHHSGSAVVNASWRQWGLNLSWIYVGSRYNQQENIQYNYTGPWQTTDLSLSRDLRLSRVNLRALLEVNNVFNRDYDVIANYPMPKRNFRITMTIYY